jgi:hypothetical protein
MRSKGLVLAFVLLGCRGGAEETKPAAAPAASAAPVEAPPTDAGALSPATHVAQMTAEQDTAPIAPAAVSSTDGGRHGSLWGNAIDEATGTPGPSFTNRPSDEREAPLVRQGAMQVNGRLPPDVIEHIVREHFSRFRLCYENGQRKAPKIEGRIVVEFVIDRSGAVSSTKDGGSTMTDTNVVACVFRAFENLSFPQPERGDVTVVYPLIFAPPPSASTTPKKK